LSNAHSLKRLIFRVQVKGALLAEQHRRRGYPNATGASEIPPRFSGGFMETSSAVIRWGAFGNTRRKAVPPPSYFQRRYETAFGLPT
jgi:hypothetical protein